MPILPINWINILKAPAEFSAEYQTVYDSFTTKPSNAIAEQQNLRVQTQVDAGTWAKKDIDYVFGAHTNDNGEALTNWFNPGTFDAVLINAPAFVAFEGFTGDGATTNINTTWTPSTDGINYVQDSASVGVYVRNDASSTNVVGCESGGVWVNIAPDSAGMASTRVNSATAGSVAVADSLGMYITSRLDSTDTDLYKNKVKIKDDSTASTGVPPVEMYFLGTNRASDQRSIYQVALGYAGAGFTQANVDDETDANEVYMDFSGKGVIA